MMIDFIYIDGDIAVIDKPAGLLSVPGRGPEKKDSAAERIKQAVPGCLEQPSVHRLDMDTSGLMVFALNRGAHRDLSIQFQNSAVRKEYTAVLDGLIPPGLGAGGIIRLRFRLDPSDRPRQIWDPVNGKEGITLWTKISEEDGRTRLRYRPLTGRTH